MTIILFGIANCDTVKRARSWLSERAADVAFHDFKKQGVPEPDLERWLLELGRDRLVNRKGTTWRKLTGDEQALAETDVGAKRLLLAQPSAIKRPVVQWPDGGVTVGFDEAQWAARLNGGAP
jgi:arsenate reductase (glutaredoxin)